MQCTEQVEHAGFLDKERELGKVLTCTRESSANDVWNCKQEIKKKKDLLLCSQKTLALYVIYIIIYVINLHVWQLSTEIPWQLGGLRVLSDGLVYHFDWYWLVLKSWFLNMSSADKKIDHPTWKLTPTLFIFRIHSARDACAQSAVRHVPQSHIGGTIQSSDHQIEGLFLSLICTAG